jgi:hypothetical protein
MIRIKLRWKIVQDKETKLPKLCGSFAILMGEKELACQDFNEGYSSKTVPFSGDLVQKLHALEKEIIAEMERLIQ